MKIIKKLSAKSRELWNETPAAIAFLGDSVTQGCFELYMTGEKTFDTVFDSESAYCTAVRKILALLYPNVPVNIIRAGINGGNAKAAVLRLERDVLRFNPDLTVVCFGLNDCNEGLEKLPEFTQQLDIIFDRLKDAGSEIIYMTPNIMNTYVSCHLKDDYLRTLAENTAKIQNEGVLEQYIKAAKALCAQKNIPVCDCYGMWKTMLEGGVDTTDLLSNHINHPVRQMHCLFAAELVKVMFKEQSDV